MIYRNSISHKPAGVVRRIYQFSLLRHQAAPAPSVKVRGQCSSPHAQRRSCVPTSLSVVVGCQHQPALIFSLFPLLSWLLEVWGLPHPFFFCSAAAC